MRYTITLLALAGSVVASPSPQVIDFNVIQAAPAPSLTAPPLKSASQTGVYNAASATISAAAAASSIASASATASVAARGLPVEPRDNVLQARAQWCFFGFCFGSSSTSTTTSAAASSTASSTKVASSTSAAATTTSAANANIAAAVTSAAQALTTGPIVQTISGTPTTCEPISWTNTFEFITTDTACPAPYEVGTYCGFINPEDPCAPQPGGAGPVAVPDTADGFLAYAPFHDTAKKAATPKGYAQTFVDYNASVSANSYLGLHTLNSYDVSGCAAWCDNTTLCTAFNIYMERDPSVNPDQCTCSNPLSITNYKCTLWGSGVEAAAANNAGGWRGPFQVVIAGSNGYEKTNDTTPTTPDGFENPQKCGNQTHDHPKTCMSTKFFPGPYNPQVCASYALSQNAKNTKTSVWQNFWYKITGYNPLKCTQINSYMIKQNGVAKGTHCKLFSQKYQTKEATYCPGWTGGKYWGIESSYTFDLK